MKTFHKSKNKSISDNDTCIKYSCKSQKSEIEIKKGIV